MAAKKPSAQTCSARTSAERLAGSDLAKAFAESALSLEDKLEHFPRYIRRQRVTRFLALYEIFKRVLSIRVP